MCIVGEWMVVHGLFCSVTIAPALSHLLPTFFLSLFLSLFSLFFLSLHHLSTIPSLAHIPYVLVGAGTASFSAAKAIREKDAQVIRTNMHKI